MMKHKRTSALVVSGGVGDDSHDAGIDADAGAGARGNGGDFEALWWADELAQPMQVLGLVTERDICLGCLAHAERAEAQQAAAEAEAQSAEAEVMAAHDFGAQPVTSVLCLQRPSWGGGDGAANILHRDGSVSGAAASMLAANQRHVVVTADGRGGGAQGGSGTQSEKDGQDLREHEHRHAQGNEVVHVLTMRALIKAYHVARKDEGNNKGEGEGEGKGEGEGEGVGEGGGGGEGEGEGTGKDEDGDLGDDGDLHEQINGRDLLNLKQQQRNIACIVNSRIGDGVTVRDALHAMRRHATGVVMVIKDHGDDGDETGTQAHEVAGLFTERDLVRLVADAAAGSDTGPGAGRDADAGTGTGVGAHDADDAPRDMERVLSVELEDVYTRLVVTVQGDDTLDSCMQAFGDYPTVNYIPVLNEHKDGQVLLGILSIKDILHMLVGHVWPARKERAAASASAQAGEGEGNAAGGQSSSEVGALAEQGGPEGSAKAEGARGTRTADAGRDRRSASLK
eukprot:g7199.t1